MQQVFNLAQSIKLLILDIDGVCTDGLLHFNDLGESIKRFYVHDGLGIKWLLKSGIEVAIITAKNTKAVELRAAQLGIKHVYQGYENKLAAYQDLISKLNVTDDQIAYIGDDLPDLCLIRRVKLGITVPNGSEHVKKHAKLITQNQGGRGAVREVCELILTAQNKLADIVKSYE